MMDMENENWSRLQQLNKRIIPQKKQGISRTKAINKFYFTGHNEIKMNLHFTKGRSNLYYIYAIFDFIKGRWTNARYEKSRTKAEIVCRWILQTSITYVHGYNKLWKLIHEIQNQFNRSIKFVQNSKFRWNVPERIGACKISPATN